MMFPDYPDIVTVRQLTKMLGISRALAYDLINDGEIQAVMIGKSYKIPKVNVINYVTEELEVKKHGKETDPAYADAEIEVQPSAEEAVCQLC